MRSKHLLFFLGTVFVASCGKSDFYSDTRAISGRVWKTDKKFDFEVDVTDTVQKYNFYINLRHNEDYEYSNIYFRFDIDFPNGKASKDTIGYDMQSPDAKWYGKNSGSIIEHKVLIKERAAFHLKGKHKIHLSHLMRTDLAGIEDVGISITPKD